MLGKVDQIRKLMRLKSNPSSPSKYYSDRSIPLETLVLTQQYRGRKCKERQTILFAVSVKEETICSGHEIQQPESSV